VGMDPRLHADLGRTVGDGLLDTMAEVGLGVLVGVRGAAALPEAAERAPDRADVRDVDVAVHDERDGLPRDLGAQLVGGLAQVLDRLGPRLGEQRGELVSRQRDAVAALGDRARHEVAADRTLLAAARSAAWDEAPVVRLDGVEDALRLPL